MITLDCLLKLWKHNDLDRVSLWTGAICTGEWLGLFSARKIPEEYNKGIVKSFGEEYDEDGDYSTLIVLIGE